MRSDSNHSDDESHYLMVRGGGHRCAIPVESVKLVTKAPAVHPLPSSAPRLLGLAQVAGEAVAVVDLHALLDPKGEQGGGHELTVIVRRPGGGASLGLAIDEAFGVTTIADRRDRAINDPGWVAGRCSMNGRTVVLLDPEHLFVAPNGVEKGAFNAD